LAGRLPRHRAWYAVTWNYALARTLRLPYNAMEETTNADAAVSILPALGWQGY